MINFFKNLIPPKRPDIELGTALRIATESGVNVEKEICIIGIRGFYNKGNNQRGQYDDAIFYLSPKLLKSFNANTDPGAFRKGIANLLPGIWSYKLGIHGLSKPKILQYEALVQAAEVKLKRDETGSDWGFFGINIHKGGYGSVSSLGCQTIHPSQWSEFIGLVKQGLVSYKQTKVKYILKDMTDEIY